MRAHGFICDRGSVRHAMLPADPRRALSLVSFRLPRRTNLSQPSRGLSVIHHRNIWQRAEASTQHLIWNDGSWLRCLEENIHVPTTACFVGERE